MADDRLPSSRRGFDQSVVRPIEDPAAGVDHHGSPDPSPPTGGGRARQGGPGEAPVPPPPGPATAGEQPRPGPSVSGPAPGDRERRESARRLRRRLTAPGGIVESVKLAELLGPPLGLRDHADDWPR